MLTSGNKITAVQINDAESTIKEIISKRIISFNIGRIRQAYKQARENANIEILSEEQKNKIKNSIINDEKSIEYKNKTILELRDEFKNFKHIRSNINNINDLSFDSVEIEQTNLINPKSFSAVIKSSINCNETFIKISAKLTNKIYNSNVQNLHENKKEIDDTISIIREMYKIDTTVDDFEIITKFGYVTNLDHVNELSEIIQFQNYSVFNYIHKTSNKNITNKFLSYILSENVSNNKTTLFPTTLNSNVNYQKVYRQRTIGELLLMISDPKTKYNLKEEREQLYINTDGTRPKENEYKNWNGLQVFDLDLNKWINEENGNIDKLKFLLHEKLINYHWYLWVVKSSSGNGLHIYTKVAPPHHQYTNPQENELSSKYWYNVNYLTKLNFIYNIIEIINLKNDIFNCKYFDNPYIDNVVSRITAGIRLSYDENPYVNNKFIDISMLWGLGQNIDIFNDKEIHNHLNKSFRPKTPEFRLDTMKLYDKKIKLINDLFFQLTKGKELNLEKSKNDFTNLPEHVKIANDLSVLRPLNRNEINYFTRYNICNTLSSVLGVDGLQIAHEVLRSNDLGNVNEINGFYTCALSNNKQPTKLGLELLKKIGIVKSISDELKTEIQEGFKNDLLIEIEKVKNNELQEMDYYLEDHEYLDDYRDELLNSISGDYVNFIFSPPGTGKTTIIKKIAASGKRVLLILPYISVIKNKIEKDKSITDHFDVFYGNLNIKDIEYGRNVVTTFDKFSRVNFDKISRMFDYIFIDESHLLFTSSYRIDATSNAIKKIKELFYISSNDDMTAKLVLMTGTETGETHFFKDVAKIIKIHKQQPNKNMEFVLCDDVLDGITRMSNHAVNLLNDDYRILIPTNKGEIYTEKIIGMISYLLKRDVEYGYYKRSNTEQEICKLIDEDNTVGDYEIIFCSNYLSVGVDIIDADKKFASLYMGNFCGFEIEQFNARIRETGIESKFFVITETQNGEIYSNLIEEPNLILKVTDSDRLFFIDDKQIAKAKQEFIAEYDPVLRTISTPGFSLLNGKIQFNLEEYELISFENKYIECMQHPVKVARELSKYGYFIKISTQFDGLDNSLKNILKQTGIDSAKQEKIRKHSLMVNSFIELIENNVYKNKYGLEYNNVIQWIYKNGDKITEDRNAKLHVNVIFDSFASPQNIIVKSREAVDKIIGYARYLIKRYSKTKCLEIFNKHVDDSGILKLKNLKRAINLLKLIDSSDNNELSIPLTKTVEKIYEFVDDFETDNDHYISFNSYQATLDAWTNEYIDMLGIKVNTRYGYDKIRDSISELLFDISTKRTSKKGIKFRYNKLPDQDSSAILNKRSIDTLIGNVFKITETHTVNIVSNKHVILQEQSF